MDIGGHECQPDLVVQGGWCRDHAIVNAGCDDRFDIWQDGETPGNPMGVTTRIGNRNELDALQRSQHPSMMAAHHAQADQACPQVMHHAPAFATALTAVTTRSRSSCDSEG
jgi:hypothetical protein